MRIIIVGCGNIGATIVESLVAEGHDVIAIDEDPNAIAEIANAYDTMGVCGNGVDCETLSEAEVEKAELFVSVTGSDEFNMLSCFLAKRMGAKHTIARIRNPEYNDSSLGFLRNQLDLSLSINPELLAAKELLNVLKFPSAVNVETFSGRSFEMVELRLKENSPLDGMKLSGLRKKYQAKFLVCAVQRGDDVYIPDGNFKLQSGDKIGLTAAPAEIQKLLKMLGLLQKQVKNVMILGASRTAYYLTKLLLANGIDVKVIKNYKDEKVEISSFSYLGKNLATVVNFEGYSFAYVTKLSDFQKGYLLQNMQPCDAYYSINAFDEIKQKYPKSIVATKNFTDNDDIYTVYRCGDFTISPRGAKMIFVK